MEVVLTSGKVSLYTNARPSEKVILNPGDQAEVFVQSYNIIKSANQDVNYLSWKTRKIEFDNARMDQIISTLRSVYNVDIQLTEPGLANCTVTATFDHQPVSSVLKVLMNTLDLKVQEKGHTFILSGKTCK